MPGAVIWPGVVKPGSVTDTMVSTMDIFPTALQVAGAKLDASYHIDGRDMSPVLNGSSPLSQHSVFLHYCGFNIVAARVWGRYKVFWGQQRWYANDPYNASVCTQCCNGVNAASKLTGTTATLLCGCDTKDFNWFDKPLVYDMLNDRLELHNFTADNWPASLKVTYKDVVAAAEAEKARMEQEIHAKPDITGAGTCTAGLPAVWRQPCCPGCKPAGLLFPHCVKKTAWFRKGERCNCDSISGNNKSTKTWEEEVEYV